MLNHNEKGLFLKWLGITLSGHIPVSVSRSLNGNVLGSDFQEYILGSAWIGGDEKSRLKPAKFESRQFEIFLIISKLQ